MKSEEIVNKICTYFGVFANLGKVQIRRCAPITYSHVVKVRGDKYQCVIHQIFLKLWHYLVDKIVKSEKEKLGKLSLTHTPKKSTIHSICIALTGRRLTSTEKKYQIYETL